MTTRTKLKNEERRTKERRGTNLDVLLGDKRGEVGDEEVERVHERHVIGHHDGRFSLAGRRACRRAKSEEERRTKKEEDGGVRLEVRGPRKVVPMPVVPLMEMEWKPMRNMM
jgi:hypothetical protein